MKQYDTISKESTEWTCQKCKKTGKMDKSKLAWGEMNSEEAITEMINTVYAEIITWDKNLMRLPRGKAGKDFILELTRLFTMFTPDSVWEKVSLSLVQIFIPLILQKPSARSKARENNKYLISRLQKWDIGNIEGLLNECKVIQSRLQKINVTKEFYEKKAFCRRMLHGKVKEATRLIDNEKRTGIFPIDDDTIRQLRDKHPPVTKRKGPEKLPTIDIQPVLFEEIDGEAIKAAAKNTHGSGGPTLIDADGWKHILCSKSYGKSNDILAHAIADVTKRLCTEIIDPSILSDLLVSRLIPLDKRPGVRPIGIGEVLQRIMTKTVTKTIKEDIKEASGSLQTCSGIESGIEAAVHSMAENFANDNSQGLLLVDASNAFNSLHREQALDTVATTCPVFHQFLKNTYQTRTKLYISGSKSGEFIWGEEGNTQGDVAAMQFYSIATRPIIDDLRAYAEATMVWYADDSSACGSFIQLLQWWNRLCDIGPGYGYYPNAKKTILIVKNHKDQAEAETLFGHLGVKITTSGERHLGAVVGSKIYREDYIKEKVEKWITDIKQLADIASEEPQLAYSAFTKGICHRWRFFMRTIPDIAEYFAPLESKFMHVLIPALLGRPVNQHERDILELPVRCGGLSIINPVRITSREYAYSVAVTKDHVSLINQQDPDITKLDMGKIKEKKEELRKQKEEFLSQRFKVLHKESDHQLKNHLDQAREKGASTWLSTLPLKDLNYVLNRQEFQDSIRLRYGWKIQGVPSKCACGNVNSIYHALDCKLGGYVSMRHNAIRDTAAFFLREAKCKDVRIEPALLTVQPSSFSRKTNTQDEARLDVAAVGLYAPFERTFFDIRVTHPNCDTNTFKTLDKIYKDHEKEKKDLYEERVLQSEKGSFVPLVFTTSGGMGPLCTVFVDRVSEMIADHIKEAKSQVKNHIRTRFRFDLLRSTLIALRGIRGRSTAQHLELQDISINLIP